MQVEIGLSLPLTLPCEFLCLILWTVGEVCFQMFPSEMPDVSPDGLRAVKCCVCSPRAQGLLLASACVKALDLRRPSGERNRGTQLAPAAPLSPSTSFMGSRSDPVVCLILIGCSCQAPLSFARTVSPAGNGLPTTTVTDL